MKTSISSRRSSMDSWVLPSNFAGLGEEGGTGSAPSLSLPSASSSRSLTPSPADTGGPSSPGPRAWPPMPGHRRAGLTDVSWQAPDEQRQEAIARAGSLAAALVPHPPAGPGQPDPALGAPRHWGTVHVATVTEAGRHRAACLRQLADLLAPQLTPGRPGYGLVQVLHDDPARAEEEIALALAALRAGAESCPRLPGPVPRIAAALPPRLPLYWLIAWGVVPSMQAREVLLWAPPKLAPTVVGLMKIIAGLCHQIDWSGAASGALCPATAVRMVARAQGGGATPDPQTSRRQFFRQFGGTLAAALVDAPTSEVRRLASFCRPDCVFLMRGSGLNPIIVGPCAAAAEPALVDQLIEARLGTFGREGEGPSAIFVPIGQTRSLGQALLDRVQARAGGVLPTFRVHDQACLQGLDDAFYRQPPTLRLGDVRALGDRLEASPFVLMDDIQALAARDAVRWQRLDAPAFRLIGYTSLVELGYFFDHPAYREDAMRVGLVAGDRALAALASSLQNPSGSREAAPWRVEEKVGGPCRITATWSQGTQTIRPTTCGAVLTDLYHQHFSPLAQRPVALRAGAVDALFTRIMSTFTDAARQQKRRLIAAWYQGIDPGLGRAKAGPVRCVLVVDGDLRGASRLLQATLAGICDGLGLGGQNDTLASLMAAQAQQASGVEDVTIVTTLSEMLAAVAPDLTQTPFSASSGGPIDSVAWRRLLVVEALADPRPRLPAVEPIHSVTLATETATRTYAMWRLDLAQRLNGNAAAEAAFRRAGHHESAWATAPLSRLFTPERPRSLRPQACWRPF